MRKDMSECAGRRSAAPQPSNVGRGAPPARCRRGRKATRTFTVPRLTIAGWALLFPVTALAHGSDPALASAWNWEPWVLACIAVSAIPYAIGMLRMGSKRRAHMLGSWRPASFFAGLAILLLALDSPLDALADDLFSAHMGQHMLLLLVIPPLLVMGRPVMTWLWAFDLGGRRAVTHAWRRSGLDATFRFLMRPPVAWVLLSVALVFWHLPGPYGDAVRNEWLHDLEHFSFLAFSLAFWTIVIEPYGGRRRLGHGETIVFVVSSSFVMSLIGAILTLAAHPLYAVQLHTTQRFGLAPLADQQLAGAIMWIPSNLIHVAALCVVFFDWIRQDRLRASRIRRPQPSARAPSLRSIARMSCVLLVIGLVGCHQDINVPLQALSDANPERGARLMSYYGCGSCHIIPGVNGANGLVGPPLTHWSQRSYIAGLLQNNPDNLMFWLQHPQKVLPGVDMPDMDVSDRDARDIAAYLYTER